MTVQVHTAGPGIEDWRSAKFAATVAPVGGSATTAYVYGYERETLHSSEIWTAGETPEQSWLNFGTDEETTVVVDLVSGSITSAIVYPDTVTQSIAGGTLTLTMPVNTRCRVEVNSDRKECLHVFASPTQTAPALGARTDWASLQKSVSAVALTSDGNLTVAAHGWGAEGASFRGILGYTAAPTTSTGTLAEHEAVTVTVVDENTVTLTDQDSVLLTYSEAGSGLVIDVASWSDTSNALYFGAGEHNISRMFEVDGTGVDIYFDEGAVVTGSFNLADAFSSSIKGPGLLTGLFSTWEVVNASSLDSDLFAMFSDTFVSQYGDNTIQGITVVAQPYFMSKVAGSLWQNVHSISCWTPNTDGISPENHSAENKGSEVIDCFLFQSDDVFKFYPWNQNVTISGCFGITTVNAIFSGNYQPGGISANELYYHRITDCHALHLGKTDGDGTTLPEFSTCVFRSVMDGLESASEFGHFNVSIDNLKVWGPNAGRLFALGNMVSPWGGQRDQFGQLADWTISDLWAEQTPSQLSAIVSKDASNTPHDLTFTGTSIGGVEVYNSNVATYITVDPLVYNIDFGDEVVVPPTPPVITPTADFVVEDGTGLATSNSYASVEFGDIYFDRLGAPATWSGASFAAKQSALRQATAYIQDKYGSKWRGSQATAAQALSWPRMGVTDGDTGFGYTSAEVPLKLQQAAVEVALRRLAGTELRPDITPGGGSITNSSFSIGGLSINDTYSGVQNSHPRFPEVESKLRALLTSMPGDFIVRISR